MEKTSRKGTLLSEVAQLKIFGGTSSTDPNLTIYIGKGCKTWGDCKKICGVIMQKPFGTERV